MRFGAAWLALSAATLPAQAPPNAPARLVVRGARVELRYQGATIFRGELSSTGAAPRLRTLVDSSGGKITQIISWAASGGAALRGTIHATRDGFAVDADPREDALPVVRHSVGPSYNRLNRGAYARSGDWLLSLDFPASARVTPVADGDSTGSAVEAGRDYVAFDFWPRLFLGVVRDASVAGAADPGYQVQVDCLRERQPHPQLLASNRHVSCGGVDLEGVRWEGDALSGTSRVVSGDDHELYLPGPEGWTAESVGGPGAEAVLGERSDHWRRVAIRGARHGRAAWTVRYRRLR